MFRCSRRVQKNLILLTLLVLLVLSYNVIKVTIRGQNVSDGDLDDQDEHAPVNQSKRSRLGQVMSNTLYSERRYRALGRCKWMANGTVDRWTRYKKTAYCILPKVGCTFWINVFRYFFDDMGGNYKSPFDIPRLYTHNGRLKNMKFFRKSGPHYLNDELRFMFVRDPYHRLWSAYIDKFFLPDFWGIVGRPIIAHMRKTRVNCASDISFKEFLEFVVTGKRVTYDTHWLPVQNLCSPCVFQPHVIGKMETFNQDAQFLLDWFNSSWILKPRNHDRHDVHEMKMLIDYNFDILRVKNKNKGIVECVNTTELAHRLWKVFQINGYLATEFDFPLKNSPRNVTKNAFRATVLETYYKSPKKTSQEWFQQREKVMEEAYSTVSTSTMHKLQEVYKDDFIMFDYDPEPHNLFAHRNSKR